MNHRDAEDTEKAMTGQSVFLPESVWSSPPIQCTARVERAREFPHRFRAEHRFPKRASSSSRTATLQEC